MPKTAGATLRRERPITLDLLREALAAIPPDIDREKWVRVGMSVKATDLPEAAAFDAWNEWSARGASYSERDAADTWRSIKANGKVGPGTLFGIAKDHGFSFPAAGQAAEAPSKAEAERLAVDRRRRQAEEEQRYRALADEAAVEAEKQWALATDVTQPEQAPYLVRKGVQGHGVRVLPSGTLLLPMRDIEGRLQNVQRIQPQPPADGGSDKRYLPKGRKTGLMHLLGELEGAEVLLLGEGYATAASVHEATGRPVAVAFDAGNLPHVAKALREAYPGMPLLVCSDDDRETEALRGINAGREKAASAARAANVPEAGAAVVWPIFPESASIKLSDFNDLAQLAGAEAVRGLVEAACQALLRGELKAPSAKARGTGKSARGGPIAESAGGSDANGRGGPPGGSGDGADQDSPPSRDPFTVDERGVWFRGRDREGNDKPAQWVCGPLHVTAHTRDDSDNGWGYMLEFVNRDRNHRSWAAPAALFNGEGKEWSARLLDMGLRIGPSAASRALLGQYIQTRNPTARITCVDKVGWHRSVYVLPDGCIGHDPERTYAFQSEGFVDNQFRQSGNLDDWQQGIGALCVGNSRLTFAVSFALCSPLLPFAGVEPGGVNLKAQSRTGKTTTLRVAASVFGPPSYMQQWRSTANSLESTAAQHNHTLLVLDELGALDASEAGSVAYMLSNGMEKGRATRSAMPRRRRTWALHFLSSGELSLTELAAENGKRIRAGQEVRMVDFPLDTGQGTGGLETAHSFDSTAELAEALTANAARFYGTAGRAWLEWCAEHVGKLPAMVRQLVDRHLAEFVPEHASSQVRTVGARFALAAAGGELATQAGITGWPEGEAVRGVRRCFEAWLAARGHLGDGEDMAMLRQVRAFIEMNGDLRLTWMNRGMDDHRAATPMRVGFKRLVKEDGTPYKFDGATEYLERRTKEDWTEQHSARIQYLFFVESFRNEICKGYSYEAVANLLKKRGHLVHRPGCLTDRQRLPGMDGPVPCYHVSASIMSDELRDL